VQGFHKDDVVAVYMESRLEFVGTWLGLAKLGIVTALINFNLRLETLAHCINSSHSKALIYTSELADSKWYGTCTEINRSCSRAVENVSSNNYYYF